jgi:hypothetical protein
MAASTASWADSSIRKSLPTANPAERLMPYGVKFAYRDVWETRYGDRTVIMADLSKDGWARRG